LETTESTPRPLHSDLANDADMTDLLQSFVEQLPDRANAMRGAHETGDKARLRILAHQMKGAAGSYGFSPISEVCRELEAAVASGAGASEVRAILARVAELCSLATHLPAR